MNEEFEILLHRWREGILSPEEFDRMTVLLDDPECRRLLVEDWVLETSIPQALAAVEIMSQAPVPSWQMRVRARWNSFLRPLQGEVFAPPTVMTLNLWARASMVALAITTLATVLLFQLPSPPSPDNLTPGQIAGLMVEIQLPAAP